jgi:hypothetical protein
MAIHDWTRVDAGTFHDFHQDWTIEIRRTLNRGVLPSGYFAMADQPVFGPEPDVIALRFREPSPLGGLAVAEAPPGIRQITHADTDRAAYARKANRIAVHHKLGRVVAIIEVISPGNKDSVHALRSFTHNAVEFLGNGVSLLVIDLFPPTPRDPVGIHQALWDELVGARLEPRPANKPLTVVSYDPGAGLDAYVEPLAVGDCVPDAPLFLGPGWYVNVPLDATYAASWEVTPQPIRDLVETPPERESTSKS